MSSAARSANRVSASNASSVRELERSLLKFAYDPRPTKAALPTLETPPGNFREALARWLNQTL